MISVKKVSEEMQKLGEKEMREDNTAAGVEETSPNTNTEVSIEQRSSSKLLSLRSPHQGPPGMSSSMLGRSNGNGK